MRLVSVFVLLLAMYSLEVSAKELVPVEIRITESFLELHTGPSTEYRIEHVLLMGEKIRLTKQHADWFYFKQSENVFGWAPLKVLLDNRIDSLDMSFDEFLINYEGELEFDIAFKTGFIEGDFVLGFEVGHKLSESIRIAVSVRQVPGKISESLFTTIDIEYLFSKTKSVRPFITVGIGELSNKPSAQVIGGETISSSINKIGVGMYFAESKRIKFSTGLFVYAPDSAEFNSDLQELSIGLKYDF